MRINIPKRILGEMTLTEMSALNRDLSTIAPLDSLSINLVDLPEKQLGDLRTALERIRDDGDHKSAARILADMNRWAGVPQSRLTPESAQGRETGPGG